MCAASHVVTSLKDSSDFQRLSRLGKRWILPAFTMLALKRDEADSPFRLGLTLSRKVGNAVIRNRAKRRLREMVRLCVSPGELKGLDIVLIGKTAAASRDFALLKQDFLQGLEKLGVTR